MIERPVQEVKKGDIVVCRPGHQVAIDGVIVSGEAEIDEALITGESAPVPKRPGDAVMTGSINIDGFIDIETRATGADSTLAKMIRLIENAQAGKPAVQRLVDRVSSIFVPVVVALAAVTLIAWLAVGASLESALVSAVAVLVIACPCAPWAGHADCHYDRLRRRRASRHLNQGYYRTGTGPQLVSCRPR